VLAIEHARISFNYIEWIQLSVSQRT